MRPRLLDLFCGAGGCTKGYQEAGFYVVGVDHEPQPNYCGSEVLIMDALEALERLCDGALSGEALSGAGYQVGEGWRLSNFSAIHASPPCQASSSLRNLHPDRDYPELIPPTRELLELSGLPYVIENVPGAALIDPVVLEGQMFEGLKTNRPRWFETDWPLEVPFLRHPLGVPHAPLGVKPEEGEWMHVVGHVNVPEAREAMGIDWMGQKEIAQAIPPAYTHFIGAQLLAHIATEQKAAA